MRLFSMRSAVGGVAGLLSVTAMVLALKIDINVARLGVDALTRFKYSKRQIEKVKSTRHR